MSELKNIILGGASELASYIQNVNARINDPSREHDMQTCQELAEAALEVEKLQQQIAEEKAKSEKYLNECKRLWGLLDDISTYGDMYKPEINNYFKAVSVKCSGRDGLLASNGWAILLASEIKPDNKEMVVSIADIPADK